MSTLVRTILLLSISHSYQVMTENVLLDTFVQPDDQPLKCSWLPQCYCKDESKYTNGSYLLLVNCTEAGLDTVPRNIPANTTVLTLNGNNITELYPRSFENLTKLMYLDISSNGITHLQNGTFDGLGNLHTLELSSNKIRYSKKSIPVGLFEPLKNLKRLNLQQYFTSKDVETDEQYPGVALSDLIRLEELLIDGLRNRTFVHHFAEMTRLISLELNGQNGRCSINRITKDMFKFCKSISSLKIIQCEVQVVDMYSFDILKSLTFLDISNNEKLRFKSLANITSGLQKQTLRELRLIRIHHNTGECVQVDVEHVMYMRNMTIGNLFLDSNRLASISTQAVDYLPRTIKGLSLKDNMILAGEYLIRIFKEEIFSNLIYINLSNQNINIDFIDAFRNHSKKMTAGQHQQQQQSVNISSGIPDMKTVNKTKSYDDHSCVNCFGCPLPFKFTESLVDIDLSDMRVRLELKDICFCKPNNITRMKLQRNIFWNWQRPFEGLDNLLNLNLAWNSCENMSKDVFHKMPKLMFLNLSRNFIESILSKDFQGEIFKEQKRLQTLDLSDNKIRYLPSKIFIGLSKLKKLYLSRNFLTTFDVNMDHINELSWLDMYNNLLTSIAQGTMDALLKISENNEMDLSVNLLNNNLSCACSDIEFVKRFSKMTTHFFHLQKYTCKYETGVTKNLSIANVIYNDLQRDCASFTLVILVSSISLFVVLAVICAGIIYRYRWVLRYFYYSAKLRYLGYMPIASNEDEIEFEHDVFVSYCDENRGFVKEVLVPELEDKRQLKVLVHDRDFIAGHFVNDNIMRAVTASRKTLIVMSRDFLKSKWCVFEMNMARMEAIKTGRNVLCVIMLEHVDVAKLPLEIMDIIREQTYLELPEMEEHKHIFWDRVKETVLG